MPPFEISTNANTLVYILTNNLHIYFEIKLSKERQRVLNLKTKCFLCEKIFPAINLKKCVSIKAVIDLRQSWEVRNIGAVFYHT